MFKSVPFKLVVAVMALSCATSAFAADAAATLASFHAALAAGDKSKAEALMAPEVAIYESGYVEASRGEYAGHHLVEDIGFAKSTARKVLKHSERIEGNVAIIWEETETTGTAHGKPIHLFGTETALLEKKPDGWSIVHVHWSSRKAK